MPIAVLHPTVAYWADERNPATTHGGEDTLELDANVDDRKYAYVKFDLSSIPASATIIDAHLRLYVEVAAYTGDAVTVHRCTTAFTEASTWASKPSVAGFATEAMLNHPKQHTWEDWEQEWSGYDPRGTYGVPRYWCQRMVEDWYDGTYDNHGFAIIIADGADAYTLTGRIGVYHLRPILEVEYAEGDTLPASAGDDVVDLVGSALDALNMGTVTGLDWAVTLELDDGDEDVTGALAGSPMLRRKAGFVGERAELGRFTMKLENVDGRYSPTNRASPLYQRRAYGRTVKIEATVLGQTVSAYQGEIDDVVQYDDGTTEVLTTSVLRRKLAYRLNTPMENYGVDPIVRSSLVKKNPADILYDIAHNYSGLPDTKINLSTLVAAKAIWTAQGVTLSATWDNEEAWAELLAVAEAAMCTVYPDALGRLAFKVWVPSEPTTTDLEHAGTLRWREDTGVVHNVLVLGYEWVPPGEEEPVGGEVKMADRASFDDYGQRDKTISTRYIRTPELATKMGQLYLQALADPLGRGAAEGGVAWLQHDLFDAVRVVRTVDELDESCLVTEQRIDILGGKVGVEFVRANWPLPRRDFVNLLDWSTGAVSESYVGSMANPVADSITGPTLQSDGSMEFTIGWTYDVVDVPHRGFAIFANAATSSPAGVPTVASHDLLFFVEANARSYTFTGLPANSYVTVIVAAYRGTTTRPYYGTLVGSDATPDWTDVNLVGSIISGSVPTNAPAISTGAADADPLGGTFYTLVWTYTQGAIEAEGFYLIANFGEASPGLPTLADHEWGMYMDPRVRTITIPGPKMTKYTSFGIAAYRQTIVGLAYTALDTHAQWTDLRAGTANIIGDTVYVGDDEDVTGKNLRDRTKDAAPTNDPAAASIAVTEEDDGSGRVTVGWTYAQGALPADGLLLLINISDAADNAAPTVTSFDMSQQVAAANDTYEVIGFPSTKYFYFGIVAYRDTLTGRQYGAVITSATAPDWQNFQVAATITLDDDVEVDGRTLVLIKTDVDDAFLKTTNDTDDLVEGAAKFVTANEKLGAEDAFAHLDDDGLKATAKIGATLASTVESNSNDAFLKSTDDSSNLPMASAPSVSVDDVIGEVLIFNDNFITSAGGADTTTPPQRTFTRNTSGVEVYYMLKAVFRKLAGYNTMRCVAYVKESSTWDTNHDSDIMLRIMNYTGLVQQLILNTDITGVGAYTKTTMDLDISGLTNGEIYQVWLGYEIDNKVGGSGSTSIYMWAPVLVARPE